MTRHALDAAHYTEPQTLALERERLFGRLWIFVGFSSMVRERNQFFTRKIAGVPVVVQRTESGIRAFLNQCPHRLSAIQTECTGQRPLVCPYHAWSFGAEGQLQGIPNSSLYQFSAEERARIGLRKLHLEEVGQLLFVNLADDSAAARAVRRWIPGNLAGGLLAPGYAADLQLPQGALQLEAEHGEREGLQPCSFRPSEDLPPGDDRPGARSGTRGCGAIRGAAPAAGRRNAGAAFAELPHQGADPALQELVLRPLRGLRRRARLLQLVHLPERELLQRPWRALPAPAVRSGGTRRDRLPPVDDDCPAQGSEDRFQRFAEHPDSRRA